MKLSTKTEEVLRYKRENNTNKSVYIYQAWNEVISDSIKQLSNGIFLIPNKNILIIYGTNDITTAELNMQREIIRDNINLYLNYNYRKLSLQIKKILVKTNKYKTISKEDINNIYKSNLKKKNLTKKEIKEIKEIVEEIEDPTLKNSLFKLIIESKKL